MMVLFLVAKQELAIVRKSLQINKDGIFGRHSWVILRLIIVRFLKIRDPKKMLNTSPSNIQAV